MLSGQLHGRLGEWFSGVPHGAELLFPITTPSVKKAFGAPRRA